MEPAICVHEIGKKYRLAALRRKDRTLREALTASLTSRFRRRSGFDRPDEGRDFWALDGVSFEVQPGEVLGIVGRNGAGKSTLLKILSQITEPTTGRVELNGRVASLLEVGTGFHPELSGRENIYLNGALLGMTRSEITQHFDEIVAFAEIGEFLDVPVKRYSSGMFVRLAFAVAAHLTSEILIIDEVLAVGDGGFQAKCLGKMRDVGASGRTVLFVSHDLAAVQALCDRALLLRHGQIAAIGAVEDVITEHVRSMQTKGDASGALVSTSQADPFVRELTLIDETGTATPVVQFRSSPTLRFRFTVPVAIRGMHFMLRLTGQDGRLKACVTSRETACTALGPQGDYDARILLSDLACLPGQYNWDIAFYRPGEQTPFVKYDGLCPFEVLPRVLPGASHSYRRGHGEFSLDATIVVELPDEEIASDIREEATK